MGSARKGEGFVVPALAGEKDLRVRVWLRRIGLESMWGDHLKVELRTLGLGAER